jgi:Carboxypeptidase regulatory-like domain
MNRTKALTLVFCISIMSGFALMGANLSETVEELPADVMAVVSTQVQFDDVRLEQVQPDALRWRLYQGDTDEGDLAGVAVDAETGNPIEGAEIEVVLISSGETVYTQTTDALGKFTIASLTDDEYKVNLSYPGYITTEMWTGVVMDLESQLPTGTMVMQPVIIHGDISGKITDALTGNLLGNVDLELRWGINPPEENAVLYTGSTGPAGRYTIEDVRAGVYTIFASKNGYRDGSFIIKTIGSQTVPNQDGFLSPGISGEEMRIVLTWGQIPSDLDSHLWAPNNGCESQNPFHLYYPDSGPFGHGCTSFFSLDLDDTSSYGPETTTIWQWNPTGSYRFLVHDYSNFSSCNPPCKAMSNSGATVTVLTATDTFVFNITPDTSATAWRVFDVDAASHTVIPLNEYFYASTTGGVY